MIESSIITFHKVLPIGEFITVNQNKKDINIIHTHQTHSTIIVEYKGQDLRKTEADGILINYNDLGLNNFIAIRTADCMPIFILGKKQVVCIHAGWKGLSDGILKNPIIKTVKPFYAFIGPSIQKESFEVSSEFKKNFEGNSNFYEFDNKLYFDLQKEAKDQLYDQYDGIKVEICTKDTLQDELFYSYRRDKTHLRNWNLFTL